MNVIKMNKPVYVAGTAAVVGKREHEGPLGADFDMHDESEKFGMDTWEKDLDGIYEYPFGLYDLSIPIKLPTDNTWERFWQVKPFVLHKRKR